MTTEDLDMSDVEADARRGEEADVPAGYALDLIAGCLSGKEWDADTLDAVAEIVRQSGRSVANLEDDDLNAKAEERRVAALAAEARRQAFIDSDSSESGWERRMR